MRSSLFLILLAIALVLLLVPVIGNWFFAALPYHGPVTDHFDGKQFHNRYGPERIHRQRDFFRWRLDRLSKIPQAFWGEFRDLPPLAAPPRRIDGETLRVTFVNHSTVLLQTQGLNILTDPIFSYRCSPLSFTGPHRRRSPGIRFADLPPIDLILLSHNHYDHMDIPTLSQLARRDQPRIVTGLGNAAFLKSRAIPNATDLDWWQTLEIAPGIRLTAVPAMHFSARSFSDRNRTLWVGFVLETPGGNIYFAGDTGMGTHFAEIRKRFGPTRLALLPIGAYLPRWFMEAVHISPAEALQAQQMLEAKTAVGIHFGTFPLADDGEGEALADLKKALGQHPEAAFWALDFGEGRDVPKL